LGWKGGRRRRRETNLIESKITRFESSHPTQDISRVVTTTARHLLPGLVLMPLLPLRLPPNQTVNLPNRLLLIHPPALHRPRKQGIHIQLSSTRGSVPQKLKDAFQPAHELVEEPVVVDMHLMHEFVEVVLVAGA
jgi:hypothetical protein